MLLFVHFNHCFGLMGHAMTKNCWIFANFASLNKKPTVWKLMKLLWSSARYLTMMI